MKRSLRLPFSLLLVIAALTLLACRSALLRGFGSGSGSSPSLFFPAPANPLNSTLLSLASLDYYEPVLKREVDGLLDGDQLLPAAVRTHRSISLFHRRDNPHDLRIRPVTRFQSRFHSPADLPRFRRSLRDWIRGRRFQPQVMSDLLRLVKIGINSSDNLTPYGSCAVVGNSGILLQREHGDLIDSHDLVIRLNNARIQGYARHVGSKTNLSFVNSNILHLCARRQGCPCHPYGSQIPIVMYLCQPLHLLDFAVCGAAHGASSPLLVTDPRFDVLCSRIVKYYSLKRFVEETGKPPEEWGKSHDEKMFHYSSGMQAVMLATGICRRVSVFGFGKSTEAKHHYHTNQKAELDLHDYGAEYAFYRDLVENPQVIPFLSESGFAFPPVVFYH